MGGGSKSFYGNYRPVTPQDGHCLLDMTPYRGIVNYHPSELVVTVRAGTPLADLEAELAAHGQMLAFEPPHFGPAATVGGCVAAGLSAAPYERGRLARFRAGRAAAGFRRTHAVLRRRGHEECGRLRRVAPAGRFARHLRRPPGGVARCAEAHAGSDAGAARHAGAGAVLFRAVARQAAAGVRDQLERRRRWRRGHVACACPARRPRWPARGSRSAATRWNRTRRRPGGVRCASRPTPSSNPASRCGGWPCRRPPPRSISVRRCWSGAAASAGFVALRGRAARARRQLGGHATLFRPAGMSVPEDGVFHPLAPALALITRRLKQELDPAGLFNPGRLILEL